MKKNLHEDDILIGPDQWIEFIDISGNQQQAQEIDEIIEAVSEFWDQLETYCVAGCCGINAFDFHPQAILEAAKTVNEPKLKSLFTDMASRIRLINGDILVSTRLNNYFHKQFFLQVLEHIVKTLDE